ncbi:SprT-like domain-containing protein Spartan, partial [Trichinella pseudospiralis]
LTLKLFINIITFTFYNCNSWILSFVCCCANFIRFVMNDCKFTTLDADKRQTVGSSFRWRVGYWLTPKKIKKLQFERFIEKCRHQDVYFVQIDFDEDISNQLDVHAVIHKVSDFIVQAKEGDQYAASVVEKLEKFEKEHPEILMIDSIAALRVLCNRFDQYSLIKDVCGSGPVLTPHFILLSDNNCKANLEKLAQSGITFPFVCKPVTAHGTELAHRMQLIFGEHGMNDIETPCVAQQFIPHDGVLYKVFAVQDKIFISTRPSLRNFTSGEYPTVMFETQKISKIGCVSELTKVTVRDSEVHPPDHSSMFGDAPRKLITEFSRRTGLSLFGMDLIVEQTTGQLFVIDVNAFPSYDSVPDFHDLLCEFLHESLQKKWSPQNTNADAKTMIDSGIGSSGADSDNSDSEKKLKAIRLRATHERRTFSSDSGSLAGSMSLIAFEPDRNRIKRYYGIPKACKFQTGSDSTVNEQMDSSKSIVDSAWETLDPNPDVHELFVQFNDMFFWGTLSACEVRWSSRMTLCAGMCSYEGKYGLCSIHLSEPLLKYRPRKDLVETLLHEMIHAHLFLTEGNRDRDGHGPSFQKHMHRINSMAGTDITIYHNFHDEVNVHRQHWWRCNGNCRYRRPFYGWVKRATNRAPGPYDFWWAGHKNSCDGTFEKVKEPEGYQGKLARKQKVAIDKELSKVESVNFPGNGYSLLPWMEPGPSTQTTVKNGLHDKQAEREKIISKSSEKKLMQAVLFPGQGYSVISEKKGESRIIFAPKLKTQISNDVNEDTVSKCSDPPLLHATVGESFKELLLTKPQNFREGKNQNNITDFIQLSTVNCPKCKHAVRLQYINQHLDYCLEFE